MPVAPLACRTVARTEVNFDLSVRYVAWVGVGGRGYEVTGPVRGVAKEITPRASIRGNTVASSLGSPLGMRR